MPDYITGLLAQVPWIQAEISNTTGDTPKESDRRWMLNDKIDHIYWFAKRNHNSY